MNKELPPAAVPSGATTFAFVSVTDPAEIRTKLIRKGIRSHVTKRQHQQRKEERDSRELGVHHEGPKKKPSFRRDLSGARSRQSVDTEQEPTPSPAATTPSPSLSASTDRNFHQLEPIDPEWRHSAIPYARAQAVSLIMTPGMDGTTSVKGLHIDTALVMRSSTTTTYAAGREACYVTCAEHDTAAFSASVLLARTHMRRLQGEDRIDEYQQQLRETAISSLKSSTSPTSPGGSFDKSYIIGVFVMATYEWIYGQEEYYNLHSRAMAHINGIVEAGGGLAGFKLDGISRRLVVWLDTEVNLISDLDDTSS